MTSSPDHPPDGEQPPLGRFAAARSAIPAKDTGLAIVFQGLHVVVMLVSFTLLGSTLGTEGYGAFVGLIGLLAPALSFNMAGIGLTIYEHVVGEDEDPDDVARSCLTIVSGFGVLFSLIVIGLAPTLIPAMPLGTVVIFVVGEMLISATLATLIAVVMATESFAAATRWRIVLQLGRGALLFALWAFDSLTLVTLGLVQAAWFLLLALKVASKLRADHGLKLGFGRPRRAHIKSTGLYAAALASMNVFQEGDKVGLNAAGLTDDAGLYGAAYRVVTLGEVPIGALLGATHLEFIDKKDPDEQVAFARRLSLAGGLYAVVFFFAAMIFAPLLPFLLGSDFEGATDIVPWLTPLLFFRAIGAFPSNSLIGLNRNGLRTRILVSMAILSVGLYFVLIPAYGWKGAAAAAMITAATNVTVTWIVLLRVRSQMKRNAPIGPRANLEEMLVGVGGFGLSEGGGFDPQPPRHARPDPDDASP